jgi:hypothetical protein
MGSLFIGPDTPTIALPGSSASNRRKEKNNWRVHDMLAGPFGPIVWDDNFQQPQTRPRIGLIESDAL